MNDDQTALGGIDDQTDRAVALINGIMEKHPDMTPRELTVLIFQGSLEDYGMTAGQIDAAVALFEVSLPKPDEAES